MAKSSRSPASKRFPMMTPEQVQTAIHQQPDFVNLKRYDYSLEKVMEAFPDGCPDKVIAAGLDLTEEQLKALSDSITLKLRTLMKVDVDV